MRVAIADIEANGLLDNVSRVWCGAIKPLRQPVVVYPNIDQFLDELNTYDVVVFHNGWGYDVPVLKKLHGWQPKCRIIDTLTMSMLMRPTLEGGHSLDAYGQRLGCAKTDYRGRLVELGILPKDAPNGTEFSFFNAEMLGYVAQDVVVGERVYLDLLNDCKEHDWKLANRIEQKIAEIVGEYGVTGWKLDVGAAHELLARIDEERSALEEEITKSIPLRTIKGSTIDKPFKKDGSLAVRAADCGNVRGPFSKVSFELPNIQSRQQLAEALIKSGWEPKEFTDKGGVKLGAEQLESLTGELGSKIARHFLGGKRRALVVSLLDNADKRGDGRVTCGAFSCGTDTGRMSHKLVTSIPKADDAVYLGAEIRDLFIAEEGRVIVGSDAAGIQLRILAHFMNDPVFTKQLIEGVKYVDDAHTLACLDAGLVPKQSYDLGGKQGNGRDIGKGINYGLIFRAGDDRMGELIGKDKKAGRKIKDKIKARIPQYDKLVKRTEAAFEARGYLIGIDGRKIFAPSAFAALNYLIQNAEAVLMKVAIAKMKQLWYNRDIDVVLLGVWHDEVQLSVAQGQEEAAAMCFSEGMKYAEQFFKFRCPLEVEWKAGKSWRYTH